MQQLLARCKRRTRGVQFRRDVDASAKQPTQAVSQLAARLASLP